MGTSLKSLQHWVEEAAKLTTPANIYWCDGSETEYKNLVKNMLQTGDLIELNAKTNPRSYLHRSHPSDVARTEHLTFICTDNRDDVGPTNNWLSPREGHEKVDKLFAGAMKGRTMYVVPYCMGPIDSPLARCGVELTDSPYVAANMRIMTRMGSAALKRIEKEGAFVRGLHSTGDLNPDRRLVMHFPNELLIKSVGSGYGGNALLGKKCHALRLGSFQGRNEGWLAEHMLIVGIEDPEGKTTYIAAAFPSACGKTNLAMLIPPEQFKGYKVWTVGDDIAWMHLGTDGRLYAINPEAGFFGVAPGTGKFTNPNALACLTQDTIFTNVALTADGQPWWEGLSPEAPEGLLDWQGRNWDKSQGPAAHPNSRFTVAAKQCPAYSPQAENPQGVPISAIIFGGRRASVNPLVLQAKSWLHGVLMGASVASETTAAATGQVGVVRRDSMAMRPFCGYNMADYWGHWLSFGKKSDNLPKIFHVNWFRKDSAGKFMWPGFGDNLRVLKWVIDRCNNKADAIETPVGYLPTTSSIDTRGLTLSSEAAQSLLTIDKAQWVQEMNEIGKFFEEFGSRVPKELQSERERIATALQSH